MTAAFAVPVTRCDQSTLDVCTIYLVGGFDEEKTFYPGRPEFRKALRKDDQQWGYWADNGHTGCLRYFAAVIRYMLTNGNMQYRGRNYAFCVDEFDNQTLAYLTEEVLAQINEW
ncbi:hypothetical protein [Pseudomonas asplenii]|uniref:hypothetical protein n=1 Tax=Pseudomonas asplenii TaxID=53407 RepID=UPI0012F85309|nr:hypothetical protein [Pseudomonas fuscovaginae]